MTDTTAAAASEPYSLFVGDWREAPRTIHGPDGYLVGGLEPDDARRLCAELNRLAAQPSAGAQGEAWRAIEDMPDEDVLVLAWSSVGYPEVWNAQQYHRSIEAGASPALPREEAENLTMWKRITPPDATPAQPDTGDVAALRSVTNMDRVREFHETFGVPVLPSPRIPADRVKMRLEILDEERRELDEALEAEDLIEVADALTDMAYLIYGTALEFGIDLNACFAEVHGSNMSKLGADGKPIYREDGKVLKGPRYSPPDLRAALSKPNAPGVV